jgi:hypothetical protein
MTKALPRRGARHDDTRVPIPLRALHLPAVSRAPADRMAEHLIEAAAGAGAVGRRRGTGEDRGDDAVGRSGFP